jgi:hypothetical protein
MVLSPASGLGRFLIGLIILATISYLVLNLVSFGGNSWITYADAPIRFGLWRVCDTSAEGLCNQWSTDTYSSNITLFIFGSSKPGEYLPSFVSFNQLKIFVLENRFYSIFSSS